MTKYIAIVGHAAEKFSDLTEVIAKATISKILSGYSARDVLISGGCPMGGIDIWAEEIADAKGMGKTIFKPKINQWNPDGYGFKRRNIDIAKSCDILYNIVVRDYPKGYKGKKYFDYHCADTEMEDIEHVKSGGCWTAWRAKEHYNKEVHWIIIDGKDMKV